MLDRSASYRYRPESAEDVARVLELARESGRPVVARGAGYSYGDAALLAEGIALDLTGMNRVLEWDPEQGIVRVEPGVTVRDLWRMVLPAGWWPPVVPGAMYPTLGGCVAVNAHGKNNWRVGTIGEHVTDLELLTPSGELLPLSPDREPDLFHAVVSGMGMLGVILSIRLRLRPVRSGLLSVRQVAVPHLKGMVHLLEEHADGSDYMVGWIDAFARGSSLGRGLVQLAVHDRAADPASLAPAAQDPPERLLGLVPRTQLWRAMRLAVHDPGMRWLNRGRYLSGRAARGRTTSVPHARFQFFHDYMPNWKRSWRPGGILQYQVFAPRQSAGRIFGTLLEESQRERMHPYLAVFKRHRSDHPFVLGYNLNGFSLSLDYRATPATLDRYREVLRRWTDDIVLPGGGRFYLAKDSVLTRDQARRMYGDETYDRFRGMKDRLDPHGLLQSELYRRLFR